MVIIVTGTPGTGKTTFAKSLAKERGYAYMDLGEFAVLHGFAVQEDKKRKTIVIDHERLAQHLESELDRDTKMVIDGHFSHELPPTIVEHCYVTKAKLPELKKRLEARKYSEQKVQENIQAEIFDTCHEEAKQKGHTVTVVWTDA
jgi:adenylate kinase